MRRLFFIDGKFLGEGPAQASGSWLPPVSYAFMCQTCGEVWAKLPVEGREWLPYRMPCVLHPDRIFDMPAGALAPAWLDELLQTFPEGVLRRELDLWWNYTQGTQGEKF